MNRLILGCGYLGRRAAEAWRERGDRVVAVTRSTAHAAELSDAGIEPIIADILDPASLRTLPAADAVLYAIGLDRTSGAPMRTVFVEGLKHVLDALPPPGRFIYVSSSSVYGQTDGEWIDEDSRTEPQEDSGRTVLDAERVLRAKLPSAIVLRFAGIYGSGRLLRQKSIMAGEPIVADAEKWLNLIHVEDGVRAVVAAAERGQPGRIYNICDGQPVRRREFYAELARVLVVPPPRFIAPPQDQPTPPHEKGSRRIGNRRMREELGVKVMLEDFRTGLK